MIREGIWIRRHCGVLSDSFNIVLIPTMRAWILLCDLCGNIDMMEHAGFWRGDVLRTNTSTDQNDKLAQRLPIIAFPRCSYSSICKLAHDELISLHFLILGGCSSAVACIATLQQQGPIGDKRAPQPCQEDNLSFELMTSMGAV
jgi:hypothetical protein